MTKKVETHVNTAICPGKKFVYRVETEKFPSKYMMPLIHFLLMLSIMLSCIPQC